MPVKMKKTNSFFFLQLTLGIFFFILGLYGILPQLQESVFSLSDQLHVLEIIFGVLELICGCLLIGVLFFYARRKIVYLTSICVFIFWAARIILSKFILGIEMHNGKVIFAPNFASWLIILSIELAVLASIFVISRQYAK